MKAKRCCGLLAAAGILLAAGIAWAADEPKSASARHTRRGGVATRVEVRTESERGGPPRVRMWVNGREVEPGRPPVDEMVEPGKSGRAFLGILAVPLSDDMREIAGADKGVLIDSLTDSSPAAKAGLLPGDVITRIDGQPVTTPTGLVERLRTRKPGDEIEVTYYRMGKRQETRVTLGEAPDRKYFPHEGGLLLGLPEGLREKLPRLREYLEGVRPKVDQWMKKWREPREESPQEREPPRRRPLGPPGMPGDPYGIGKDVGRLLERMDRIERHLDEIERSLDEEFEAIQRRIDRIHEENDRRLERLERRAERPER